MQLEKLFWSKCRKKILEKFILESRLDIRAHFFIRELCRDIGEQINAVRRELINLENLKILKSKSKDNKKVYTINRDCPIIEQLELIFVTTFDAIACLKTFLKGKRKVDVFVVCENINDMSLKQSNNVVDILIIGEIEKIEFNNFLAQKFYSRKIKYAVISRDDFLKRLEYEDKLIFQILRQKGNIFLKDSIGVQEYI